VVVETVLLLLGCDTTGMGLDVADMTVGLLRRCENLFDELQRVLSLAGCLFSPIYFIWHLVRMYNDIGNLVCLLQTLSNVS
jgi:hypothetical protein